MSVGVVTSQFTDPVLRGSLMDTFRVANESREFEWKKCGFEEMTSDKAFEEIAEFAGLGLAPRREELAQLALAQGYEWLRVTASEDPPPKLEGTKLSGPLTLADLHDVLEKRIDNADRGDRRRDSGHFLGTAGQKPDMVAGRENLRRHDRSHGDVNRIALRGLIDQDAKLRIGHVSCHSLTETPG